MQTTTPINILIADDHKIIVEGIKLLFSNVDFIHIPFECSSGEEALQLIEQNVDQIDIALLDIEMNTLTGIELCKIIKAKYPQIKVLIFSAYHERNIIYDVISAEADGFILKYAGQAELLKAIQNVYNDTTYYDNKIIDILKEYRTNRLPNNKIVKEDEQESLTSRETEILKLVCQEYSTDEIAKKLFITPYAVNWHRRSILKKTNAKNIVSIIKYAIDQKII